jgi:hypothetical protein
MRPGFLSVNYSHTDRELLTMQHWAKCPGFLGWAYKTMYYWYKIAFFDETPEDNYEAETISVDYIIFSDI